jgi:hypothetical protein
MSQAIVLAAELEEFRNIFLQSKGIVFLGTPHRGSSVAAYGKTIADITNIVLHVSGSYYFTGGINTSLLQDLHTNSSNLLGIAQSFVPRSKSLAIASFYETEVHPVTRRLVGSFQAVPRYSSKDVFWNFLSCAVAVVLTCK